jgi:opacity protein-like surface antigen
MPACSQISKGSSTIGGSFSLSYQETKHPSDSKTKQTTFDLRPDYGIFIIDNLCIGASIGTTLQRSTPSREVNGQKLNNTQKSLSLGPFVRYYLPVNSKLYGFAHAGYSVLWSKINIEYDDLNGGMIEKLASIDYNYTTKTWNIGAGLSYFITPHTALEGMIGYAHYKYKTDNISDEAFNYAISQKTGTLALGIGLRIFLRKSN